MEKRERKINGGETEVQVSIANPRSEIDLEGYELLKLEIGQAGTRVVCTTGTLWLTQEGDFQDHLLNAGQSFILDQPGMVLVQGLPCGKALIREMMIQPMGHKSDCSGPWDYPLEV